MSSAAATVPAKHNIYAKNLPKKTGIPVRQKASPEHEVTSPRHKHVTNKAHLSGKETSAPKSTNVHRHQGPHHYQHPHYNQKGTFKTTHNHRLNAAKNTNSTKSPLQYIKDTSSKDLSNAEPAEIMEEYSKLKELNFVQTCRINELEQETEKMMTEFKDVFEENADLKKKIDVGKITRPEPYSRVFEDRKILREAEAGYKKRIARFEQEQADTKQQIDKLEIDLKAAKDKLVKYKEIPGQEKLIDVLTKQIKALKTENQLLKSDMLAVEEEHAAEQKRRQGTRKQSDPLVQKAKSAPRSLPERVQKPAPNISPRRQSQQDPVPQTYRGPNNQARLAFQRHPQHQDLRQEQKFTDVNQSLPIDFNKDANDIKFTNRQTVRKPPPNYLKMNKDQVKHYTFAKSEFYVDKHKQRLEMLEHNMYPYLQPTGQRRSRQLDRGYFDYEYNLPDSQYYDY